MRFELIDRVVAHERERLVAIKSVTAAEEYLGDHFPGFPILPGVMMLEALVQAGRLLLTTSPDGSEPLAGPQARPLVMTTVKNVTYGHMVRPGEHLEVEVSLRKQAEMAWDLMGVGRVGEEVAVKGRFVLAPLPRVS